MKRLFALPLAAALILALAAPATAGKVSLSISPADPHLGDTIEVIATNNNADQVWVRVSCYDNDVLVLDTFAYVGDSSGVHNDEFVTITDGTDCVLQLWRSAQWRPTQVTFEFSVLP